MNKKAILKLLACGLLQWVALMMVIFVISLILGVKEKAEMSAPPPLGFVLVAVIMVIISWAFGRWLKPASRKEAVVAGLVWSGMTTAFWLITVIANDTQAAFNGNWGVYLMFVAQVIGSIFIGPKKSNTKSASPRI